MVNKFCSTRRGYSSGQTLLREKNGAVKQAPTLNGASRYACLVPTSAPLEIVRHPVGRPVIAVVTLTAFLATTCVFPLASANAQTKPAKRSRTAPAKKNSRAVAPNPEEPGHSQRGALKASQPPGCKDCEVSLRALDLSRPPTEKELRMAISGC